MKFATILCVSLATKVAAEDPLLQNALAQDRGLQTTGEGFGNDPTACTADGVRFTCVAPSGFSVGENNTKAENVITCDLNSQVGMDFQNSENCICNAKLEDQFVGGRTRDCACAVCPRGSAQAVAYDCSNNVDDPYITATCVSIGCNQDCNASGIGVFNQPTPAPDGPEDDGSEADSGVMAKLGFALFASVFGYFVSMA